VCVFFFFKKNRVCARQATPFSSFALAFSCQVDLTKAPKIPVALNRHAKAAYATYKVLARLWR
jgi:hypothetical protein